MNLNKQGIKQPELEENVNFMKPVESEFTNKRVPLDGIELLLNREKVPDSLGKKLDKKNIKEQNELSDLDDIISDAESIEKPLRPTMTRQNERLKRRVVKKRDDFFPKSKFEEQERSSPVRSQEREQERPPRDSREQEPRPPRDSREQELDEPVFEEQGEESLSDIVSVTSLSGSEVASVSGESEGSVSSKGEVPNINSRWKSPSLMSKDEIMSEKMDLLYKYSRLEGNGYKSGLNLNMRTPLETLRTEVTKLDRMRDVQRSIRTQRKVLISFASGTEYVNKKYNPYKFALDGWSGDVLENIGDYDEVFEELHDKYKDSVQMAPELKLLTLFGGSALMFHLSNTLFKSSTPELNDILKSNPDIMAQIQKAALGSMASTNAGDPIFNMMMNGVNEKKNQQAQQAPWDGRKGYAPPRTSGFPQASNMNSTVGAEVNQVPQGQGLYTQPIMKGPPGVDDILNQLNASNMGAGLISDVEEEKTKEVSTKKTRKPKKKSEVIDLDM